MKTTTVGANWAHGTPRKYGEGKCRCDICTDANTARNYASRAKREGQEPPSHGASGYRNYNCTCSICVEGNREAMLAKQRANGKGTNSRKEWTEEEIEIALRRKDHRRYAFTALEVAQELGRSVAAVNARRGRGGTVATPSNLAAPGEND